MARYPGRLQNQLLGCAIMAEDWDNLLILDACRYDMFEDLNTISGDLKSRRSRGSATREFVQNNFSDQTFYDTVYVTANPFVTTDAPNSFHERRDVWRTDWNEQYGTVLPDSVRGEVLQAARDHGDKRLIGHFMQPHHPFIGPTGKTEIEEPGFAQARRQALGSDNPVSERRVWHLVRDGELSHETLVRAYRENLEVVLPVVEELVEKLPGKTVVTSDHGNLLNEPAYRWFPTRPEYAHPMYGTATPLVKVPWLVCPADGRRQVTSEPPQDTHLALDNDELEERLSDLGYV